MYIAVILENFSQATEDVQQGLTQDDIDMYYDIWARFDTKATEYILLESLSEFVDTLEEPLRLAIPNAIKLITLDIPICQGDRVHCVDVLDALTKNLLGTTDDAVGELSNMATAVMKHERKYAQSGTTMERQRQRYCAKVIQVTWRRHMIRKREQRTGCSSTRDPAELNLSEVKVKDDSELEQRNSCTSVTFVEAITVV
jgi:hypothetical protein